MKMSIIYIDFLMVTGCVTSLSLLSNCLDYEGFSCKIQHERFIGGLKYFVILIEGHLKESVDVLIEDERSNS